MTNVLEAPGRQNNEIFFHLWLWLGLGLAVRSANAQTLDLVGRGGEVTNLISIPNMSLVNSDHKSINMILWTQLINANCVCFSNL